MEYLVEIAPDITPYFLLEMSLDILSEICPVILPEFHPGYLLEKKSEILSAFLSENLSRPSSEILLGISKVISQRVSSKNYHKFLIRFLKKSFQNSLGIVFKKYS